MQIFKVFVTNLDSLGVRIEAVKIGVSTKKTMHGFRDFNGNALVHGDDPFEDRIIPSGLILRQQPPLPLKA
ncbi:hypothetical protein [Rhizobium sp.]|uniref:hypothetical protein n=1 Tax=Rhizobium sp. TaxID=391 RepID=UPI0028A6571D